MKLKIGTRKSKLALRQAEMAAAAIKNKFSDIETEFVCILTEGDRVTDKALSAFGGKGVFVSEIENALLNGSIDIAVHSAKDMSVSCTEGLAVTGVLERGDPYDLLIFNKGFAHTDSGFTVGTGSMRRRCGISAKFPEARFMDIRGNVDTRLNKLKNGEYDSIMLAAAGIERLSLDMSEFSVMKMKDIIPAPCQAIIALETRTEGTAAEIAAAVSHEKTFICFETERYAMKLMGADCTLPIGALSVIEVSEIILSITKDGRTTLTDKADVSERFSLADRMVKLL